MCCHQSVLDCHKKEKVRFVVTNLNSIFTEDARFELLPERGTEGKKYNWLPRICAQLSQKGKSSIFCHQFLLESQK